MGEAVYTVMEYDGMGIRVPGSPESVAAVIEDARRHGEESAALLTDAGLVHFNVSLPWEFSVSVGHAGE
jgi:hypothetical protein